MSAHADATRGASPALVIAGNLLIVVAFLVPYPFSLLIALVAATVLIPEAVIGVRAWRQNHRMTTR